MNVLDASLVTYINEYAQQSIVFDHFMNYLATNRLFKGGIMSVAIWWLWFRGGEGSSRDRVYITTTLAGAFAAIAVARVLVLALPFRLRPLHEPGLTLNLPHGINQEVLDGWSSFPSDHAVLFFAISAGLMFVSRRIGALFLVYTSIVIGFPRIYLGFHYPTDIMAGALIGILIGWAANSWLVKRTFFKAAYDWSVSRPSLFYPAFFLVTYQIADIFSSSRALLSGGARILRLIFE